MPTPESTITRKKRPSIKDVAERAGVSTATVSHVFSGKKHVNEKLARRVRNAASDLGYAIDRVASQLRSGRARVIAILVPDLEDLFLNRFVSCIEALAESAGYEVIVSCSRNDPSVEISRLRALIAWRPAGIVAIPCRDSFPNELHDELINTPIVGADRIRPSEAPFDTVTIDNFSSGRKTAEHLIAKGAKSILIVTATIDLFPARERVRGAKEIVEEHTDATLSILEIGSEPVAGAERLSARLTSNPKPDAIVGLTNVTTLAALSALVQLGMEAPKDLLLVGFHDSLWMTARKTPVTTIAQPVDEVARCAWERLTLRMAGERTPFQNIVLSSNLIERASTKRPS
ncbi:MAG: LacI family DNA-binding transcriptional regulator [Pseudomonadota bacterium]